MFKYLKKLIIAVALVAVSVACAQVEAPEAQAGSIGTRAVWVSFYELPNIGLKNRTESAFRTNATKVFTNIKSYGCTDVYFHVRAFDDAIYPSKVVGWSEYIVDKGKTLPYDPLKILVEIAHKKGLKFHAWMNPYRVTKSKILNPAKAATNTRIVKQVKEIINNYDVDGIHFDDYFYTSQYPKVKAATRRKNVNKLIKKVYKAVKAKDKNLLFGISPAGNYDYCMSIGADVKTWMSKSGYIDYIVPQIYWSDKYKTSSGYTKMFTNRLKLWRSLNKNDIPMYIGLALYRTGLKPDKSDLGWSKKNTNLKEQVQMIRSGNTEGYALFTYGDLLASHSKKELKNFLKEISWIHLNSTTVTLKKDETYQLTATWRPTVYTAGGAITFKSLDESIATVTEDGLITAIESGTVKIQAISGDKKKNCTVTIE